MKRTVLTLIAGATALFGFAMVQRKSSEQAEPHGIIKETFWSKLRELWAIRQRCRQIKFQQRKSRLNRNCDAEASIDPASTSMVRVAAIEPIDEANGPSARQPR